MDKQSERPMQDMHQEIHNLIGGRNFGSMEELQAVLSEFSRQKNTAPIKDFHGLSSEQMHRFLHFPFESPNLVSFPDRLPVEPRGNAAFLLSMLVEGIGEKGLKLTARGNLGQKFCREAAARYRQKYPDTVFLANVDIRTETNFEALHVIRLSAQLGGLVRKYKGRVMLTKKCRKALDHGGIKALYPHLFNSYCQKLNWAYRDGFDDIGIIQHSFLFTLYLLHKYGDTWRPSVFYADNFRQAFPMALQEVQPTFYAEPEKTLQQCYILRTLNRFAGFFGLAEIEQVSEEPIDRGYRIRSSGLLDQMVQFHL